MNGIKRVAMRNGPILNIDVFWGRFQIFSIRNSYATLLQQYSHHAPMHVPFHQ